MSGGRAGGGTGLLLGYNLGLKWRAIVRPILFSLLFPYTPSNSYLRTTWQRWWGVARKRGREGGTKKG